MDVQDALSLVDRLLYVKTNKHLNDLERRVFIGSWQGQTYEEIYPRNPEYIEKTVGYRLWQKLSEALGEKISKKRIRGALERVYQRQKRIFISYRNCELDRAVAEALYQSFEAAGYLPFASDLDAIAPLPFQSNTASLAQVDLELKRCDCFILLLSPQTAVSEMVMEELRRLRQWRNQEGDRPLLVVVRTDSDVEMALHHDLRNYLQGAIQWQWSSSLDTPSITQAIQQFLEQGDLSNLTGLTDALLDSPTVDTGLRFSSRRQSRTQHLTQFSLNVDDVPFDADQPSAERSLYGVEHGIGQNSTNLDQSNLDQSQAVSQTAPLSSYPLPTAEPEIPRGQVRLASAFYVERAPYEPACYDEIGRPGMLIRIKAPRQMGKTSLMARIIHHAQTQKGYQAIPLSFQHADREIFQDLGSLLRWFCAKIARKLHLPPRLETYWDDTYGSKDNCTTYFEDYLLPEIASPLVLGLDEVDAVFQYPQIADDFFGLLRAWYEEASYGSDDSQLWEKLRLVVVHSTEVYIPLDVNQSPFNVGLPIELSEFTAEQVADLAHRHQLNWTDQDVRSLMTLVGGHPYLVRLAMYYIAQNQLTLAELHDTAPTEAGIYSDHLRRHLWQFEQYPDLARAYSTILHASAPVPLDSEQIFKLHSMGLVHLQGNGAVPSFELYRRYFCDRIHLPPSTSE